MSSIALNSPEGAEVPEPLSQSTPGLAPATEKSTYAQILKSSALIGGSSVLNIAIGIVRTKAMAMLLGPAGFGLFGLYGSIADVTQSIVGMGINSSGVRQIAEAAGSNNSQRIALTATVLRRMSIFLGVFGAVLLVLFSRQVSTLTFGNEQRAAAVSTLAVVVLFRLVSAGQGALIQGMRRIPDLAKMGVFGALFGTLISITVVYFFREKGVVPSLAGVAAMTILTSWWYSRKVQIEACSVTVSQVGQEAAGLLKLGFAFMASGFLTMGVAYGVRLTVLRQVGVAGAGLYQSAWTLGGLYVGFILQAMGADFYPRLTANANNNSACNRMVNEQARIGLLLAGPGVIGTLTFAPVVIALFYTSKFTAAVEVLRWICLGTTLQVITWPMGFIILAKGKQSLLFWSELAWAIVHVCFAWICVRVYGVSGAGIAFFGSYIFHGLMIYPIVRHLSGFGWSLENKQTGLLYLFLIAAVFCGLHSATLLIGTCLGTLAAGFSLVYSMKALIALLSLEQLPPPIRRLIRQCRTLRPGDNG